jgi:hypothetical protein
MSLLFQLIGDLLEEDNFLSLVPEMASLTTFAIFQRAIFF